MKLACWNVNSVRARLPRLLAWLEAEQPDVVCLQELKVEDADFPRLELEALGYRAVVHGKRTYNGVGILARSEPRDVVRGLGDGVDDPQARLIAATVDGVRVVCVYVPNGSEVGSDKWDYKRAWLGRLRQWLDRHAEAQAPLALCGDFNVAPEARDVHDPAAWEPSVLFHPEARAALAHVTGFGLRDTLRLHHADAGLYSWWDYRMLAFPKNRGLRIDLILATQPLAARCTAAGIHREQRKGQQPSDHAPIWAQFSASA
jgi:exodeoxyribonuclease-3